MTDLWLWFGLSVGFFMIFGSPIIGNSSIMILSGLIMVLFFGYRIFRKKK
jgi:RsiW-degrading membrane proteinase PrsW (M82 family)